MNDNLDILLPVHNEAKSIAKLIPEIINNINEKINYTIIICEDGSTDNTLEVIESFKDKYPIKLITSKNRKGYSIAVLDGIRAATADYLLIMDSDGQSNPKEIINFWKNRKKANLINGNRIIRKDYMYRKFYSKFAFFIYRLLFSIPLKDPSYAYLIMEKKVFLSLNNFKCTKTVCEESIAIILIPVSSHSKLASTKISFKASTKIRKADA